MAWACMAANGIGLLMITDVITDVTTDEFCSVQCDIFCLDSNAAKLIRKSFTVQVENDQSIQ